MPLVRLGQHSSTIGAVIKGFEKAAGLPLVGSGDRAWLRKIVALANEKHGTDIELAHENYGWHFKYSEPKSAVLMQSIATDNGIWLGPPKS